MPRLLSFLLLFVIVTQVNAQSGYKIEGQLNGIKDTSCILAFYYGNKTLAKDTALIGSDGSLVFESSDNIKDGMYMIVFPDGNYMEMVMIDKFFSFTADLDNIVQTARFKDSPQNTGFYNYMQLLSSKKNELNALKSQENSSNEKKIETLTNEMLDYQSNFSKNNPNLFFGKMLKASEEVQIPDAPVLADGKIDSMFQLNYYKAHFFDNFDFSDDRMIRTPILHSKVNTYLENLTHKIPDSIIVSCDYLIEKSRSNSEMFKYMVSYLTSTYERSKIMGVEKVFVHLVEKYFKTNQVDWIDETQMFKIVDRAETIKPLCLGEIAPNIAWRDPNNKVQVLENIQKDFTLLIFYDPDCGHCKKEVPVIKQEYDRWKEEGISVEVYAASVELDKEKWIEFIKTYDISEWTNVGEFKTFVDGEYNRENDMYVTPFPYIKQIYDISGTPKYYLLDKNKKILVNAIKGNIGVDQLSEIIRKESAK